MYARLLIFIPFLMLATTNFAALAPMPDDNALAKNFATWEKLFMDDDINIRDNQTCIALESLRQQLGLSPGIEVEQDKKEGEYTQDILKHLRALTTLLENEEIDAQEIEHHRFLCFENVLKILRHRVLELQDHMATPIFDDQETCATEIETYLSRPEIQKMHSIIYTRYPRLKYLRRTLSDVGSDAIYRTRIGSNPLIPVLKQITKVLSQDLTNSNRTTIRGCLEAFHQEVSRYHLFSNKAGDLARIASVFRKLGYCPDWDQLQVKEDELRTRGLANRYSQYSYLCKLFSMLSLGIKLKISPSDLSFSPSETDLARMTLVNPHASHNNLRKAQRTLLYAALPLHQIHALATIVCKNLSTMSKEDKQHFARFFSDASGEMRAIHSHLLTILEWYGQAELPHHVFEQTVNCPVIQAMFERHAGNPHFAHIAEKVGGVLQGYLANELSTLENRIGLLHALQTIGESFTTLPPHHIQFFDDNLQAAPGQSAKELFMDLRNLLCHLERMKITKRLFRLLEEEDSDLFDGILQDIRTLVEIASIYRENPELVSPLTNREPHVCKGLITLHTMLTQCIQEEIEEILLFIPNNKEIDTARARVRGVFSSEQNQSMNYDEWLNQRKTLLSAINILGITSKKQRDILKAYELLKPNGAASKLTQMISDCEASIKARLESAAEADIQELDNLLQGDGVNEQQFQELLARCEVTGKQFNKSMKAYEALVTSRTILQDLEQLENYTIQERSKNNETIVCLLKAVNTEEERIKNCRELFNQQLPGINNEDAFIRKCRTLGIHKDAHIATCKEIYACAHPQARQTTEQPTASSTLKSLRYHARRILFYLDILNRVTHTYRQADLHDVFWPTMRKNALFQYACKFLLSAFRSHAGIIAAQSARLKTSLVLPSTPHLYSCLELFCKKLAEFGELTVAHGNALLHNHHITQHDTRTNAGRELQNCVDIIRLLDGIPLANGTRTVSAQERLRDTLLPLLENVIAEQEANA